MANAINPISIFIPMLVIVALTFVAFIRMAVARTAAVKSGQDPNYYKAHLGDPEPEETVVAVRHYGNLFELPVLFYVACLTAFVLEAVNGWTLAFAWAYAVARLLQSTVHMTYNNASHRGLAFVLGILVMFALWMNLAMVVFARI